MLQTVNDLRVKGEGLMFKTKLPKSFLALLVSSLKESGVNVKNIYDECGVYVIGTSHGTIKMKGSFSVTDVKRKLRNEIYATLNERFDKRVRLLCSKGWEYIPKYLSYAKSEREAHNGWGLTSSAIMYMDDFLFNMKLETL